MNTYWFSVNKHAPLALVCDEELPAVSQLNHALLPRNLPGRTLQFQIDVDRLFFRSSSQGDLKHHKTN